MQRNRGEEDGCECREEEVVQINKRSAKRKQAERFIAVSLLNQSLICIDVSLAKIRLHDGATDIFNGNLGSA